MRAAKIATGCSLDDQPRRGEPLDSGTSFASHQVHPLRHEILARQILCATPQLERAQPLANGIASELGDTADVQLAEHVLPVRGHCLAADMQALRNLLRRVALGDQLHELTLPW